MQNSSLPLIKDEVPSIGSIKKNILSAFRNFFSSQIIGIFGKINSSS